MAVAMPSDRPPRRPPVPASFVAGTRATAPTPLEETGDSAWQLFQELQRMHGLRVSGAAATPAAAPAGPGGFERTHPMQAAAPVPHHPAQPQAAPVDLEAVMRVARLNNRACPLPEPWAALHDLLPARVADGKRFAAPAPFDAAAWHATSAMQKRLRLRDQIEWAGRVGALPAVFEFLSGLREEEWHHFG